MNDKKHTPGPWEVMADPSHYDSFTTVVAGSGEKRKGMLRELIVEIGGWAGIETAEANARLIAAAPDMLDELMNYCAECKGDGAERCPFYNKDGDMCRIASNGTCETWMTICKATWHDPATPWEVTKMTEELETENKSLCRQLYPTGVSKPEKSHSVMYELLRDILDELHKSHMDAMETGNCEGSSLPSKLVHRLYETLAEVEK